MDIKSFFSRKAEDIKNAFKPYTPYVGQVAQGIGRDIKQQFNPVNAGSLANRFYTSRPVDALARVEQSPFGDFSKGMKNLYVDKPFQFGQQMGSDLRDLGGMAIDTARTRTLPTLQMPNADPVRWQSLQDQAGRGLSILSSVKGVQSPKAVAGFAGLSGLINTASEQMGGQYTPTAQNPFIRRAAENSLRSFDKAIPMAGITSMTNPFIDSVTKGTGWATRLPLKSALNVGEGLLIDRATGLPTTKESIAIDAIFPLAGEALGAISKNLLNRFSRAVKSNNVVEANKVIREAEETIKRNTKIVNGKKLFRNAEGKVMEILPNGSMRYAETPMKTVKTTREFPIREFGQPTRYGKLTDEKTIPALGLFGGIEIGQDENGNPKLQYNSTKGLLGLGIGLGVNKAKGSNIEDIYKASKAEEIKLYEAYKNITDENLMQSIRGLESGIENDFTKTPVYKVLKDIQSERKLNKISVPGSKQTILEPFDIGTFGEKLDPKNRARAIKILSGKTRIDGGTEIITKAQKIKKLLNDGYNPSTINGKPVLKNEAGNFYEVTKIESDYAKSQLTDIWNQANKGEMMSMGEGKNLIAQHNIKEGGVLHADRMGGLPLPSIAISRKDYPLENFGDISLLAGKQLYDPSIKSNKIFNADAYTPRYPTVNYQYNNEIAKQYLEPILDKVVSYFKGNRDAVSSYINNYGGKYRSILEGRDFERNGRDALENAKELKAYFAMNNGVKPDADYKAIEEVIRNKNEGYQKFIDDIYTSILSDERLLKGYTNAGNKRFIPHSLDNVVRAMKSSMSEGEGFNYGLGTVRSKVAKKYTTLSQIKADRDKIIPSDKFEEVRKSLDDEWEKIMDDATSSKSGDYEFGDSDRFSNALIEGIRNRNIKGELEYYGFKNVDVGRIERFLGKLRDAPSEYFEVKPQRAVGLNEFKVAVVPDNTPEKIIQILKSKGLKIYVHGAKDRARIIAKAAEENNLAFGAVAGIEPYQDEDGQWRIRYNPGDALLGMAAVGGLKAVKGKVRSNGIDQPKLTGMGEVNQLPKQEVKGDKYAFNINKKTLGTSEKANEVIDQAVEQVRPILEANKGKKLTHKEIIREGKKAAILDKVMTREETADFAAKLQATRNMLKSQSESTGITQEYLDNLAVLSSTAADAGRRLNAFSVGAEDVSLKQQVVKELLDVGVEANKIIEGAKNVDWNNAKQVTEFYRKYKPARLGEYLTEFRYTNMLSSPLTHIVNTFSNLLQGGVVAPVEKTVAGGLDFAYSKLTGAERKYFASQGIDYTKGFVKAIPEAFDNFRKAFSGGAELSRPDLEMIPTTTNNYWNLYKTPLTALEAADQFFKTLVRSGEMESLKRVGKTGAEAEQIASRKADYRLFRQAFDPEGKLGQGKVLQYWDKWNSQINRMRQLPGGKWIVPFLQTPTNILKQGVEYSPLGVFTAIGAKEPIEQLSKASIGSAVFMTAYGLANSGLTTWDAPTSAKEKEEFYAAGLQPYSIKMGDKWVSYSKLGPLSYPIAMASALKWAGDNNGGDDVMSNLGNGIGGSLQFFADQSYVRGIGDIIDALRGDEYKQSRALANIPLQTIPYDSFQGWVTRIIDPVYRKTSSKSIPDAIKTNIMAKTPGLSNQLPAYQTPFGEQSNRQFPKFNAVSPFTVSQENPNYMAYYKNKQVERNANRELTAAKNEAKATLTSSGNVSNQGEKVFYNDGTSVNTLDLGKYAKKPTDPIDAIRLTRDQYSDALKVFRADGPSKQEKSDIIRKIGLKPEDISYYDIASDTEDIKQIVVSQAVQGSKTREQLISNLIMLTKEVNGKKVLSDTAINELAKRGIISKTEQTFLKNIENVNGKLSLKPQSFKPKAPKVFKGKQADVKYNFYDPKIARLSTQSGVGAYQAPTPRLDVNLDELRNPTAPKFRLK